MMSGQQDEQPRDVLVYEVDMALGLSEKLQSNIHADDRYLHNAIVDSLVLHTRIICDILIAKVKKPDDISLEDILPDFTSPNLDELRNAYGTSSTKNSPCWLFNKTLAHATREKKDSHDYTDAVKKVWQPMLSLLREIHNQRPIYTLLSRDCASE